MSPSKEELLASIRPDMKLNWNFFKRIYGYEISWPGFAEKALTALEAAGCSRAREYYNRWVSDYETKHEAEMREVAHWYRNQLEKEYGNRRRKEVQELWNGLKELSNSDLLTCLENLAGEA